MSGSVPGRRRGGWWRWLRRRGPGLTPLDEPVFEEFALPAGSRPHDVAPAPDGTAWYVAQGAGELGRLDPATGEVETVPLGGGSAPHGVIVGPEDDPWITDGGRNAIIRVGVARTG